MRLLLNNYPFITRTLAPNRYYFSTALDSANEAEAVNQQNNASADGQTTTPQVPPQRKNIKYMKRRPKSRAGIVCREPQLLQNRWQISADHMMEKDFGLLESKPVEELASKHLREYEQSLGLSMDLIKPKLYNQQYYKSRLAEFHLNSVSPLTKSFLNQRINFLNKDSFYKLIQSNKIRVLRELLENGAFQNADFVNPALVRQLFELQFYDERNQFLLNVLSYESSLVQGVVGMKDRMLYKSMRFQVERVKSRLTHSKTLNKLRLLWSFNKLYLYENNMIGEIINELSKVSFRDGTEESLFVKKESNFICGLAFSQVPFSNFISTLLKQTRTFDSFMRAYSLSIMLLSKLLSIPQLLQDKNSNELHPVLQLIEYNLAKEEKDRLLSKFILELLSHQDHSRIHYENYKRCYNYWLKDYTQPANTKYHSPLSRLLDSNSQITVVYEQRADVASTARSIITINRSKKANDNRPVSQREMINNLLQGKYQLVLDYFMTTFTLHADPQLTTKFAEQMKKIDKTRSFISKDEEALSKLQLAANIFFRDSLPKTLNAEYLTEQKEHFVTMSVLEKDPEMSTLPLNIDRNFKDMKYKMLVAEQVKRKPLKQQNDQTEEVPITEQSLQPLFSYLSYVIGDQDAQLSILALSSDHLAQKDEFWQGEGEEEQQMMEEEDYDIEEEGEFQQQATGANQSEETGEEIRTFAASPMQDKDSIDYQLVQFDETYFELATERNKPRSPFKAENRNKNRERTQPQYRIVKKNQTPEPQPTFFSKNKGQFATTKPWNSISLAKFSTQVQSSEQTAISQQNIFDWQHIQQYRAKPVDRSFLDLMKSEVNIPQIGSGTAIAKYLFLHSKREGGLAVNSNRSLNIQFMSSIGTRTTNYEKYLNKSLFNYELEDELYEEMLLDQLKAYNRFQFKQIVAHIVNFKQTLSDSIVDVLCQICEKEAIGYTFVEIAQFIKVNAIVISGAGLQRLTRTWYRFDIINEDMLSFIRQYCYKMNMQLQTEFYGSYCKSLIKAGKFDKLQIVCTAIITQIRPKPFRVDSSMKLQAVAALEKQWKEKEQQNYIKLFVELIEVIVTSIDNKVPTYMDELFNDYRKLKPVLNEKELGFAFVCYCQKRPQFEQLLALLQADGVKGTSFMYDCLLKALLSNFSPLQDLSEKILETTVFKNRIILTNHQISQSLIVFKRSSNANSFSSFLEHCLRFQQDIHTVSEIKREMYYILNNNVNEVSVSGVYNLLDFIFNEKREKERIQYRKIKLSEEEKQRKLAEIQQAKTKVISTEPIEAEEKQFNKKKKKQANIESEVTSEKKEAEAAPTNKKEKEKTKKPVRVSQKQKKQSKRQIAMQKKQRNKQVLQYLDGQYQQTVMDSQTKEVIDSIRQSDTMSLSAQRGCLKLMDGLYGATIQLMEQQEDERAKISEQAKAKQELQTEDKKSGKGGKGKAKAKK